MFAFFEKHRKKIIIGIILVLGLLALITSGKKLNATAFESAFGFIVTPFQEITDGIGGWVNNTLSSRREKQEILDENEALRQEVRTLQADNNRLALYEAENETLSGLLKIAQKYPQFQTFGVSIIAKSPGSLYDVFTLNKGSSDGVQANMVLAAPEGLVGKVLESGATYAKGQSILDSRSSVPAMSLRTGDLGVVKGDYILMNDGLCKMEYIDAEAEIAVGDEIVTSHLSDIYPPGLTIGKVKEIKADSNGLTKYAIIEPAVDMKHLDTLLVIDKNTVVSQNTNSNTEQPQQSEQSEPLEPSEPSAQTQSPSTSQPEEAIY